MPGEPFVDQHESTLDSYPGHLIFIYAFGEIEIEAVRLAQPND
jgi:hypothetical protein